MKQKILLADGCSYTSSSGFPYKEKEWPVLLSEKLNLKCKSLGGPGSSNDKITSRVIEYIIKNHEKIKMVCILWTEWLRFDILKTIDVQFKCFCSKQGHNYEDRKSTFLPYLEKRLSRFSKMDKENRNRVYNHDMKCFDLRNDLFKLYENYVENENPMYKKDIVKNIIRHFVTNNIIALQNICRIYNIEYYFMNGMNPDIPLFPDKSCLIQGSEHKVYESIYEYQSLFDTSKYIGWPVYSEFDGYSFDSLTNDQEKYHISSFDKHPNKDGHKLISNTFYEKIKNENAK